MFILEDGQFTLSVNPKQLRVTREQNNKNIELLNIGQVSVPGKKGLIKLEISTFLPDKYSHLFQSGSKAPDWIVSKMEKNKNGQKAIRIIISGTDINKMFLINNMTDSYSEGQRDTMVTWSFVEFTELNVAPVASKAKRADDVGSELCARSSVSGVPKSVVVKKGDSFWAIGKRYYDDGSMGEKIAALNGLSTSKILHIGIVLEMPQ